MNRQAILDRLEEVVTIFFLTAGPALGLVIFLTWLVGLSLGFLYALLR